MNLLTLPSTTNKGFGPQVSKRGRRKCKEIRKSSEIIREREIKGNEKNRWGQKKSFRDNESEKKKWGNSKIKSGTKKNKRRRNGNEIIISLIIKRKIRWEIKSI